MLIGKRISGRYKILDIIGGGGMANVYLAHDIILDRDVAIKILRLDFANDEEFIRRFRREAQNATSLVHPNIVSIYDVGEEDSIYYIVMEYVKGQTLKQYIQQHSPVPVETALDIMRQLTSAIAHAHQNHIIHRDIKPQNILIDEHGHVKITDFNRPGVERNKHHPDEFCARFRPFCLLNKQGRNGHENQTSIHWGLSCLNC